MRLKRSPVAAFVALDEEIDTRPLLAALAASGAEIVLPRQYGRGLPLRFHRWSTADVLAPGPFGVREPLATAPLIDPVLLAVPLLAFDERGGRLGYGGGFYDRTLSGLRERAPDVLAIGFAFELQRVLEVPMEEGDERLDGVVTEAGPRMFDIHREG